MERKERKKEKKKRKNTRKSKRSEGGGEAPSRSPVARRGQGKAGSPPASSAAPFSFPPAAPLQLSAPGAHRHHLGAEPHGDGRWRPRRPQRQSAEPGPVAEAPDLSQPPPLCPRRAPLSRRLRSESGPGPAGRSRPAPLRPPPPAPGRGRRGTRGPGAVCGRSAGPGRAGPGRALCRRRGSGGAAPSASPVRVKSFPVIKQDGRGLGAPGRRENGAPELIWTNASLLKGRDKTSSGADEKLDNFVVRSSGGGRYCGSWGT